MELIVLPEELRRLLRSVDGRRRSVLALNFGQMLIDEIPRDAVAKGLVMSAQVYLATAGAFLDGAGVDRLLVARDDYFSRRTGKDRFGEEVTWVAELAVSAACQRGLEDAGAVVPKSFQPSVLDVAVEGQRLSGRLRSSLEDSRWATWNMAKRQLLHLVATEEYPGGDGTSNDA